MNRIFETIFDSYQAVEKVGEGGSGQVFRVESEDGQTYAVKCLDADKISTKKLKRFKNELYFCLRNVHINIIQVHDYGTTTFKGKECLFYVMPYHEATLRSLIEEGIGLKKIPQYFSQILEAVQVAHQREIWHRDLKPENILYDSSSDLLLVADFGIAHFCEEFLQTSVETGRQERLANFQYAAPEQRTKGRSVDFKADVYALGLILNEMFTGEVPHGTNYKIIASMAHDFAHLDELIERMIRQSPDERPTIREVINELRKGSLMSHEAKEAPSLVKEQKAGEINLLSPAQGAWDEHWLADNRARATEGLEKLRLPGSMEICYALSNQKLNASPKELLEAAKRAEIHAFGWAIGVVPEIPEYKPRPTSNGIVTEVTLKDMPWVSGQVDIYDFWTLRTNGDFYLNKSIYEDSFHREKKGKALFFDTRIERIAEALLHCTRLYSHLGVQSDSPVHIMIRHSGLKYRLLLATSPERSLTLINRTCVENEIERIYQIPLTTIEADLVSAVKQYAQPLFALFDFQEFHDKVYRQIIEEYTRKIS